MPHLKFKITEVDSEYLDQLADDIGMPRQDVVQFCFGRLMQGLRRPGMPQADANNVLAELRNLDDDIIKRFAKATAKRAGRRKTLEQQAIAAACFCIHDALEKAAPDLDDEELQEIANDPFCDDCHKK